MGQTMNIRVVLVAVLVLAGCEVRSAPFVAPSPVLPRLNCKVLWIGSQPIYAVYPVVPTSYTGLVRVTLRHRTLGITFPERPVVRIGKRFTWHRVPAADQGASAIPDSCTATVVMS